MSADVGANSGKEGIFFAALSIFTPLETGLLSEIELIDTAHARGKVVHTKMTLATRA